MRTIKTQVAIVGAGPAGSLLAILLHQAGINNHHRITLVIVGSYDSSVIGYSIDLLSLEKPVSNVILFRMSY